MATSYSNPGGSGTRTVSVSTSSSSGLFDVGGGGQGVLQFLIDGFFTQSLAMIAGKTDGHIKWDFAPGAEKVIDAFRMYSLGGSHGTWQWYGSNNNIDYTALGASFTLAGAVSPQTYVEITEPAGNVTPYRYYRLTQIAGATQAVNVREFEFRIEDYVEPPPESSESSESVSSSETPPESSGPVEEVFGMLTILNRNATQSFTISTWTRIAWDNEEFDDVNAADLGTNAMRITVPSGFTRVKFTWFTTWAFNSTGQRLMSLEKNSNGVQGAGVEVGLAMNNGTNESPQAVATKWLTVTPGDHFEFWAFQSGANPLNLSGSAVFGGPSYVQAEWEA